MRRLVGLVRPLGWLAGLALALDLLQLSSVVEHAKAIAACLERAKFELVLCEAPTTTDWAIAVTVGLAVALSFVVGWELNLTRRS